MKAYGYEAVTFESEVYCVECSPVDVNEPGVNPIFAESEWESFPICINCGAEHSYVSLIDNGEVA